MTVHAVEIAKVLPRFGCLFRDATFSLAPGSLTHVVGTNGSGKSTLLRIVAGVCRPSSGRISGRGRVAIVPDRFTPPHAMSVRHYLTLMGRIHGLHRSQIQRRINDLVEELALHDVLNDHVSGLSKGLIQRVGIAQAFLDHADLVVLDEPFTGLDATSAVTLTALITRSCRAGSSVLMCDHESRGDLRPDRVLEIENQRIVPSASDPRRSTDDADLEICWPQQEDRPCALLLSGDYAVHCDSDLSDPRRQLRLRVPRAHLNQLLLTVIQQGWQVCTVEASIPARSETTE